MHGISGGIVESLTCGVEETLKGNWRELMGDFRNLETWRECRKIRMAMWELSSRLPPNERYRLADQIIRASRSSTANIAEGCGRYHYQENIQFCRQARGSLYELIDHILVAEECKYIGKEEVQEIINKIEKTLMLLNGYIRHLHSKKKNNSTS